MHSSYHLAEPVEGEELADAAIRKLHIAFMLAAAKLAARCRHLQRRRGMHPRAAAE